MTTFPSLLSTKKKTKQKKSSGENSLETDIYRNKNNRPQTDLVTEASGARRHLGTKNSLGQKTLAGKVVQENIVSVIRSGPATSSTYSPPHLPMPKVVVLLAIT